MVIKKLMHNLININYKSKFKTKKHFLNRFFVFLGLVFFLMMLVLPTTLQIYRGFLLLAICICFLVRISYGGIRLHWQIIFILCLTLIGSIFFMLNGLAHGAPGALRVGSVYILWPILFVFLASFLKTPFIIIKFNKIIVIGTIISALAGIVFVLDIFLGLNMNTPALLKFQGAAVGFYEGFVEYRLFNMTTLIYGFPFLIASVLSKNDAVIPHYNDHFINGIAIILTLIAAAISGRRAFWLIIVLTPFIVGTLALFAGKYKIFKKSSLFIVISVLLLLLLALTPLIDLNGIASQFLTIGDEFKEGARYTQFNVLMNEWMEMPLLGHGAGAAADGIIRSEKMSWAYELSYVALLFHTGIIGCCLYSLAILWIFVTGIRIIRNDSMATPVLFPLLVGLAAFLIVNATNPYLGKFDYLWTIFLPVAAINAYKVNKIDRYRYC
jgi:hypothetical protein